ncbi:flagellar protein FliT [Gracilibacillus halotolerans]|uniref:Flagellar protein FliT n=1 Tax=Gracilibacillus halotolerans TaxID=74386 RepID=A0A841RMY2_9BACI|nr:hypothetical protein [Gracilibacillus halotolerans]MBB6512304.1 flagellar protein FliT [Gracilibacillus halotolerans]
MSNAALQTYITKTEEMLDRISEAEAHSKDNESRDHVIEIISNKIVEREDLLEKIKGPYSDKEAQLGRKAVELDKQLQSKLALITTAIRADMRIAKKQQRTHSQYANPYNQVASADGMYLDSRK